MTASTEPTEPSRGTLGLVHGTASIMIQLGCNLRCGFCVQRDAEYRPESGEEVQRRLRAAVEGGLRVVRLTGGEPLVDERLESFVRLARGMDLQVEVETNALAVAARPDRAVALARAGVRRAWVTVWAASARLHDALAGQPGALAGTWAGVQALHRAGITVGLNVAVLRQNLRQLPAVAQRLAPKWGADAMRLWFVTGSHWIAPLDEFDEALRAVHRAARRASLRVTFEGTACPPPCALSEATLRRLAAWFSATGQTARPSQGERAHVDTCAGCALRARCAGWPLDDPGAPPRALSSDEARAIIVASHDQSEQLGVHLERPHTSPAQAIAGGRRGSTIAPLRGYLRLVWACNQRCRFCWVDFGARPPSRDEALTQVRVLAEKGCDLLVITGGEPTLSPHLLEVVTEARKRGIGGVELQTNALAIGRSPALAARLAGAGLTRALVSLHSHRAEVSDQITRAPGTWELTVAGIDALLGAGVEVALSTVLGVPNAADAPGLATFVAERWKGRVGIAWAAAHPVNEAAALDPAAIAPLSLIGPPLREALALCLARGVPFGNMGERCGVPPCVLGADPGIVELPGPPDGDVARSFVHLEPCAACALRDLCPGVRRLYARLHGADGLQPLTPERAAPLRALLAAPPGSGGTSTIHQGGE